MEYMWASGRNHRDTKIAENPYLHNTKRTRASCPSSQLAWHDTDQFQLRTTDSIDDLTPLPTRERETGAVRFRMQFPIVSLENSMRLVAVPDLRKWLSLLPHLLDEPQSS